MKLKDWLMYAKSSLTIRCLIVIVLYAAFVILVLIETNNLADQQFNGVFTDMETLAAQEEALAKDDYQKLASLIGNGASISFFDKAGNKLYASGGNLSDSITADELPIINNYGNARNSYHVFEEKNEDGKSVYRIVHYSTDALAGLEKIEGECVVDQDLNILSGNLFPGKKHLTEFEFSLLKGIFENRMSIEKYEYTNADGEERTLVLATPVLQMSTYETAFESASRLWLISISLLIVATVLVVLSLAYTIRCAIKPLDAAIKIRRLDRKTPVEMRGRLASELRPTFDNFAELMDELDASQQEKQRIITDVSHDLKTPLTVILGYAQALFDGTIPDNKRSVYLATIREKAIISSDMLDSLFTYAKMDHPSYRPELISCDMCEFIRSIVIDRSPDVEQAGCTIEAEIDEESCPVLIDTQLFQRMIANLIDNAFKHNVSGTQILVSCRKLDRAVGISVLDTGRGIPKRLRDHIFEEFITEDDARSAYSGTGLGLSIAKRCADLNGATIEFSKKPRPPFSTEAVIIVPLADQDFKQ